MRKNSIPTTFTGLLLAILMVLAASDGFAQRIYDGTGRHFGSVENDRYYDGSGRFIASAEGLSQRQIVLFFYFYK